MEKRKCPVCGREFTPDRRTQRYCSAGCRRWGYRHGLRTHGEDGDGAEPVRSFRCARCGTLVEVTDPSQDRRRRFCSPHCEKLYWKHKRRESAAAAE